MKSEVGVNDLSLSDVVHHISTCQNTFLHFIRLLSLPVIFHTSYLPLTAQYISSWWSTMSQNKAFKRNSLKRSRPRKHIKHVKAFWNGIRYWNPAWSHDLGVSCFAKAWTGMTEFMVFSQKSNRIKYHQLSPTTPPNHKISFSALNALMISFSHQTNQ